MWKKPSELTNYKGSGFEIAHGGSEGFVATAESAFTGWKNSQGHNDVMINGGIWISPWKAVGMSIHKGYAVVWFGKEEDTN
ncbi:hypothetical protein LZF95_09535 [Algoriphagus sp. AGSA1]|uniref:hypothetical protein n=1 Tax=Algoriphagus sp. AGSA1 TaxID=2907213 RepID=UPI001F462716|nr:hypothetical protein [Algoriphagus sp. AGSA1]MCE7054913.1 hypothetical protein [Algoriphagus sp. AGSA1]